MSFAQYSPSQLNILSGTQNTNIFKKNIHTKTKAGNKCIKNSTNSENVKSIRCYQ